MFGNEEFEASRFLLFEYFSKVNCALTHWDHVSFAIHVFHMKGLYSIWMALYKCLNIGLCISGPEQIELKIYISRVGVFKYIIRKYNTLFVGLKFEVVIVVE